MPHLTSPRRVVMQETVIKAERRRAESHALVNRVAGPFMSSARSSTARSCVHAGKVFFSVCFTGGQGYRGGKRGTWQGAKEMEEEEEEEVVGREFYVQLLRLCPYDIRTRSHFFFVFFYALPARHCTD